MDERSISARSHAPRPPIATQSEDVACVSNLVCSLCYCRSFGFDVVGAVMSYETYQPIYDATRSRIGQCDPDEVIRQALAQQLDFSWAAARIEEQMHITEGERQRPSVLFKPTISLDGNMYCALYGEDLMAGIAGFGETMDAAMRDFDQNWLKQKAPSPAKSSP